MHAQKDCRPRMVDDVAYGADAKSGTLFHLVIQVFAGHITARLTQLLALFTIILCTRLSLNIEDILRLFAFERMIFNFYC